jgi:NCS1 family nucleobase:cation symporter-1
MSPDRAYWYSGGWNPKAVIAFAASVTVSVGLNLLGAQGVIPDVGDWGWLIGASLGATVYRALSGRLAACSVYAAGE